jgi:hypothetical protein
VRVEAGGLDTPSGAQRVPHYGLVHTQAAKSQYATDDTACSREVRNGSLSLITQPTLNGALNRCDVPKPSQRPKISRQDPGVLPPAQQLGIEALVDDAVPLLVLPA